MRPGTGRVSPGPCEAAITISVPPQVVSAVIACDDDVDATASLYSAVLSWPVAVGRSDGRVLMEGSASRPLDNRWTAPPSISGTAPMSLPMSSPLA